MMNSMGPDTTPFTVAAYSILSAIAWTKRDKGTADTYNIEVLAAYTESKCDVVDHSINVFLALPEKILILIPNVSGRVNHVPVGITGSDPAYLPLRDNISRGQRLMT